jgi:hypothetical protein
MLLLLLLLLLLLISVAAMLLQLMLLLLFRNCKTSAAAVLLLLNYIVRLGTVASPTAIVPPSSCIAFATQSALSFYLLLLIGLLLASYATATLPLFYLITN